MRKFFSKDSRTWQIGPNHHNGIYLQFCVPDGNTQTVFLSIHSRTDKQTVSPEIQRPSPHSLILTPMIELNVRVLPKNHLRFNYFS